MTPFKRLKSAPKPITMIVDGDILIYQAVLTALDEEYMPHEDAWQYRVEMKKVREDIEAKLESWAGLLGAKKTVIALGSQLSYRKKIFPEYKSNRGLRKPLGYAGAVEWVRETYECMRQDWLEADDLIGITMTALSQKGETGVSVSTDKDMLTIPGFHQNMGETLDLVYVEPLEALSNFYCQVLSGDAVDGYKGIPGIGPVKAENILYGALSEQEMWKRVKREYLNAGLTVDYAITMAQMAWLSKSCDSKSPYGVPIWSPPNDSVGKVGRRTAKK